MATGVVSVALCTHNGERFIEEQVLSILAQSQPPVEIVLSDDASTDSTVELARNAVKGYIDAHPECMTRLRVIHNAEALGVVKNFEQAILACGSELVALSDQDDTWAVDKLERAVDVFARRPGLLLLHTDARLVDEAGAVLPGTLFGVLGVNGRVQSEIHDGAAFELLLRRNFVTGATTVMRRHLAQVAVPFPTSWVHDEWLAIIASAMGELDVLPNPLVDYRQHESNQIGARRLSVAGKFRRVIEPGADRNRRLLARASELVRKLEELGGAASLSRLAAARRKLLHEQARSSLKPHRWARLIPILREVLSGGYHEFGRGFVDAGRDLVQPLRGDR